MLFGNSYMKDNFGHFELPNIHEFEILKFTRLSELYSLNFVLASFEDSFFYAFSFRNSRGWNIWFSKDGANIRKVNGTISRNRNIT